MSNKASYTNICSQKADTPLFLQPWWLDVVCGDWDAAIAKKGDEVTGIWPYPIEKKIGVSIIRTPGLTPYMGPHIFFPNDVKESNRDGFEHETITELINQLPDAKVWQLALAPGVKQAGIFKAKGLKQQVQQTFLIDLVQEEIALFANMKENMRRNIKAAEKELTISEGAEHLQDLYDFQKHTLEGKGKGLAYSFSDLKQLFDACKVHDSCTLYIAKKGADIQAIVWNAWDAKNSYYLMGGQNPAAENYRAMAALIWHAMKESKKRCNSIFDLEGSMDPGVERFFRGFGGRRELYLVLSKNTSLTWKLKEILRP